MDIALQEENRLNKNALSKLLAFGIIPPDRELSDEQFKAYDEVLGSFSEPLSFDEAEQIIDFFSNDCDDLNWGLLHLIETVPYNDEEKYLSLIAKCTNAEWRELLIKRYNNAKTSQFNYL